MFVAKLRGDQPNAKDLRERENKMALAGLRNTAEAFSRLPGKVKLGSVLASIFKKVFLENQRLRKMLVDMSSGEQLAETLDHMSQELDMFLLPARENLLKILSCRDTAAVYTDLCSTDIRTNLLERWAQVARHPGVGVYGWLKYGADAELNADPVGLEGVFSNRLTCRNRRRSCVCSGRCREELGGRHTGRCGVDPEIRQPIMAGTHDPGTTPRRIR